MPHSERVSEREPHCDEGKGANGLCAPRQEHALARCAPARVIVIASRHHYDPSSVALRNRPRHTPGRKSRAPLHDYFLTGLTSQSSVTDPCLVVTTT